jgi:hypothetical protein
MKGKSINKTMGNQIYSPQKETKHSLWYPHARPDRPHMGGGRGGGVKMQTYIKKKKRADKARMFMWKRTPDIHETAKKINPVHTLLLLLSL